MPSPSPRLARFNIPGEDDFAAEPHAGFSVRSFVMARGESSSAPAHASGPALSSRDQARLDIVTALAPSMPAGLPCSDSHCDGPATLPYTAGVARRASPMITMIPSEAARAPEPESRPARPELERIVLHTADPLASLALSDSFLDLHSSPLSCETEDVASAAISLSRQSLLSEPADVRIGFRRQRSAHEQNAFNAFCSGELYDLPSLTPSSQAPGRLPPPAPAPRVSVSQQQQMPPAEHTYRQASPTAPAPSQTTRDFELRTAALAGSGAVHSQSSPDIAGHDREETNPVQAPSSPLCQQRQECAWQAAASASASDISVLSVPATVTANSCPNLAYLRQEVTAFNVEPSSPALWQTKQVRQPQSTSTISSLYVPGAVKEHSRPEHAKRQSGDSSELPHDKFSSQSVQPSLLVPGEGSGKGEPQEAVVVSDKKWSTLSTPVNIQLRPELAEPEPDDPCELPIETVPRQVAKSSSSTPPLVRDECELLMNVTFPVLNTSPLPEAARAEDNFNPNLDTLEERLMFDAPPVQPSLIPSYLSPTRATNKSRSVIEAPSAVSKRSRLDLPKPPSPVASSTTSPHVTIEMKMLLSSQPYDEARHPLSSASSEDSAGSENLRRRGRRCKDRGLNRKTQVMVFLFCVQSVAIYAGWRLAGH